MGFTRFKTVVSRQKEWFCMTYTSNLVYLGHGDVVCGNWQSYYQPSTLFVLVPNDIGGSLNTFDERLSRGLPLSADV